MALLLALALGLSAGCGDDQDDRSASAEVVELVGAIDRADRAAPNSDAVAGHHFVAVVRDGDRVTGYACDGRTGSFSFEGALDGDGFALKDDGGATLAGTFDGDGVSGELTVGGRAEPYTATAAAGIGGLDTLAQEQTLVSGDSRGGNRLELTYDPAPYAYEGTVASADGDSRPISGSLSGPDGDTEGHDEVVAVVLDSGISRGWKTAGARPVRGTSWVDPEPEP